VLPCDSSLRTRGEYLLASLRARVPPYELPYELISTSVALCNRMEKYNAKWKFIYRGTSSGATVPGPNITGDYITSHHQPFNKNCKCNQCVNGQRDIQMKAKADRDLEPTPREIRIRELKETIEFYSGQVEEMKAVAYPSKAYVNHGVPSDQVRHMLRVWEKQNSYGFLEQDSKNALMKFYHQSLNTPWYDRLIKDAQRAKNLLARTKNKMLVMEGLELQKSVIERQKTNAKLLDEIFADPPTFEVMRDSILKALTNFRDTPKSTWDYHIMDYQSKMEHYQRALIAEEATPEPSVRAPDGFEDPPVIIPQSREIAQVIRRISQSPMQEAEYYFGVHDNGEMVLADKKKYILTYFLQFYEELLEEGFKHNSIQFLDRNEFLSLQKTFRSIEESEEGWVEYKSTGSHNTRPVTVSIETPPNWRVIQLTIRSKPTLLKVIPHASEVKDYIWGTPPLSITERTIGIPNEICRTSRYRPACFLTPEWKDMTLLERQKKKAEDNNLLASASSLGKTLTAVTESLILSRQFNNGRPLRELDLGKKNDLQLYFLINNIQRQIIEDWSKDGHDKTCDELKKSSAELRVIWQTGNTVNQVTHHYTELFVEYLHYLSPIHNDKEINVIVNDRTFLPNAYGLCVMGTLSRALPPPSAERCWEATLDTYKRFKTPTLIEEERIKSVRAWTAEYYKNMRPPSLQHPEFPGVGACLERPRGEGGVGSLISQFYHILKKGPDHPKLPNTSKWWERWKDLPALQEGNVCRHQLKSAEFAYALSLDICSERLEHFRTCIGRHCKQSGKHFPLLPMTIPEQGHKTRVPCLGSGFFNIIQQPIRKSLFEIIERDERCAYRTKGGENRSKLGSFLKNFEKAMLIHSGDLTVSTDNFSIDFNWAVAEGLRDTGKITDTEYLILKAATGPFRMIEPGDETNAERNDLLVSSFWEKPEPTEWVLNNTAKKMYEKMADMQDKRTIQIPVPPTRIPPPAKKGPTCPRCSESIKTKRCMVITKNPHANVSDPIDILYETTDFDGHLPPIIPKKLPNLGNFVSETGMQHKYHPEPCAWTTPHGQGLGFDLKEAPKDPDIRQIDAMLSQIDKILRMAPEGSYLTQKGMQMSQALSITMLYTLNIYCDDQARKVGKGMSLLCGDDSLRAGNILYIEKYRAEIAALGGVWSKTKDVVGSMGHGIFTEQHFSDGRIFNIPKVKITCKTNPRIPGWKTILQSANSAEMPEVEKIASAIKEEMLYPYRDDLKFLQQFLPIGLDRKLGGLGEKTPIPWVTEEILASIQELTDIDKANDYLMKVTKCFHIDTTARSKRRRINLAAHYPEGPSVSNTMGYFQKACQWLYLEKRRLRSALEATMTLEDPAYPPRLEKTSLDGVVLEHISRMSKIKNRLIQDGVFPPTKSFDEGKIRSLYHHDVPRRIVDNIIGTLVITPNRYQLS